MYAPLARAHARPRRFWLATALTLLQPGLGHVYCGRVRTGLALWSVALLTVAALAVFWARWLFLPDAAVLIAIFAWLALEGILIADLRRWIARAGATYQLRPVNHPLTYLGVGLGLGALPVLIGAWVLTRSVVGAVDQADYAMFPTLLPGDAVLYDRLAYADAAPAPGDLVVIAPHGRGAVVSRVIATGGQTVRLFDGRPSISGQPIRQAPLADLRVPRFTEPDRVRLDALDALLEINQARRYPVTYRPEPIARPTLTIRLAADELYVLGDNRDAALASGAWGRITRDAVLGRPRRIWSSADGAGRAREGRPGLELR